MRMILFVFGLTFSALGFVWKMNYLEQMPGFATASAAPTGASLPGTSAPSHSMPSVDQGFMAQMMAMAASQAGGLFGKGSNAGTLPQMPSSMAQGDVPMLPNGLPDTAAISAQISRELQSFDMGGSSRPKTPAMVGSSGARFVSAKPRN